MRKQSAIFWLTASVLFLATFAHPQGPGQMPPTPATLRPPVISALHPASVKAGMASLVVFVVGQNFSAGISTAQFGGSDRPTVVFNPEVLAFEATKADLAEAGTTMIDVVNKISNSSITSNSVPFLVLP
jgi:hypothetical protein